MGSTIVVRGTASDPDGVAAVTVNGIPATLSPQSGLATSSSKAGSGLQALSFFNAVADLEPDDEDAAEEVAWSVEVELVPGDNTLVVAVEDENGEVTPEADIIETRYLEVPITFTLDEERTRVVGLSWTLTPAGRVQRLVEHDYEASQQTVHEVINANSMLTCLRPAANNFYFLTLEATDSWVLRRLNLHTKEQSSFAIDSQVLAPGEGFQPTPYMGRLVCNDASDHAYLLVKYAAVESNPWGSGGFSKSRIVWLNLSSETAGVLTESGAESPPWLSMDITMAGEGIVSLPDLNEYWPLTSISPSGERELLAPDLPVGGMALAALLEDERVYVATFAGIDEVRLDIGEKWNISEAAPDELLMFSQARSMAVDLGNQRIIVGDSDLDALIEVDIATGERAEFLVRRVGQGPLLVAPRAFAVTADESLAYVADDGGNGRERLFEVDLTNGSRRVIGSIDQPGYLPITGLALDEEGQRVFVARHDVVLEVDLESEVAQKMAVSGINLLNGVLALAYDAANDRLLIGDSSQAIIEINPVTLQQNVVSRAETVGAGPPFDGIVSIAPTGDGVLAYVANQGNDQLMLVNLETGDREVVSFGCLAGLDSQTLQQVLFDEAANQLIVLADGLFIIDIDTSACTAVPSIPHRVSPLHVQLTTKGRLLAAVFNALGQLDTQSGDVAIIAK